MDNFESRALDAMRHQQTLDLSQDEAPTVPAQAIRRFLLQIGSDADPHGFLLKGAAIEGKLDLSSTSLPFPIAFESCSFSDPLYLEGATIHSLALIKCECAAVVANGARVARDIDLSRSLFTGGVATTASASMTATIWLSEAQVGGRLLCIGTQIHTFADRGLQADSASFGGNIRFINGFRSNAELRLIRVRVTGSIDFAGATVDSTELPDGRLGSYRAVDLGEARIDGSLFFLDAKEDGGRTYIAGRVELGHAVVDGRLTIRSATFVAPPVREGRHWYLDPLGAGERDAIWAPRLRVAGDLSIQRDCRIDGGVYLEMCEVGGAIKANGQHFANPGRVALNLRSCSIAGSLSLTPSPFGAQTDSPTVSGSVVLEDSDIGGRMEIVDCSLSTPSRAADSEGALAPTDATPLLDASGVKVGRDVDLQGMTTVGGEVRLTGARVGGDVVLDGASLENEGGNSLTLRQAQVEGSIHARGRASGEKFVVPFRAKGTVNLDSAQIGGRVDATGSQLQTSGGVSLSARSTEIGGRLVLSSKQDQLSEVSSATDKRAGPRILVEGSVFLNGARIHGAVALHGAVIRSPAAKEPALNLADIVIDGPLLLDVDNWDRPCEILGAIRLKAAHIKGNLSCDRARLVNAGKDAIIASGLQVDQDVFFGSHVPGKTLVVEGRVRMSRARVGGQLSFSRAVMCNAGGEALSLREARVQGALVFQPSQIDGGVDLSNCSVAALLDEDSTWTMPDPLQLDGFTYDRLGGTAMRSPSGRVDQMVARSAGFSRQPYTQLGDFYRRTGDRSGARDVAWRMHWAEHHASMGAPNLFTRTVRRFPGVPPRPEPSRRSTVSGEPVAPLHTRLARRLLGHGVGFGYRFWRPTVLAAALVAIGWITFSLAAGVDGLTPTDPAARSGRFDVQSSECANDYPCVRPLIYSVDVLLPVVDLRQDAFWVPDSHTTEGTIALWVSFVMAMLGWGVVGVTVAGIAERLRDPA